MSQIHASMNLTEPHECVKFQQQVNLKQMNSFRVKLNPF